MDSDLSKLLNRAELYIELPELDGQAILVTGSSGFLGRIICAKLTVLGAEAIECDIDRGDDILDERSMLALGEFARDHGVSGVIHLAAHKYAALGEERPASVADVNIRGTQNIVDATECKVVLASTCKAADPCTCYGASKLIAERIVLNAGGIVVRLVNVLGSTGSVLQIWGSLMEGEPTPVAPCKRMWMTPDEAANLLIAALSFPTGRYGPDAGEPEPVKHLARRVGLTRISTSIPLRRGDRPAERLVAEYEHSEKYVPGVLRIADLWQRSSMMEESEVLAV